MKLSKYKKPAHHQRLVSMMVQNRNRFIAPARKALNIALNKQVAPVLHYLEGHHHASLGHIDPLIQKHPLEAAFKAMYKEAGHYFGKARYNGLAIMASDGKEGHFMLHYKADEDFEDEMDTAINDFIAGDAGKYITSITETTREKVKHYLQSAIDDGVGAADLAMKLRDDFTDFNRVRSYAIARTEIGRASNFAGDTAADMIEKDYDVQLLDTWLHAGSSKDDRETHLEADGQEVKHGETFDIDADYHPYYPQDGSGGADEEVNCNCLVVNEVA